jgi:hypothetical protein
MTLADEEVSRDCDSLRAWLELLEDERTLPTRQVIDLILDWRQESHDHRAVADYLLWMLNPQIQADRVYITWADVDSILSDLEGG